MGNSYDSPIRFPMISRSQDHEGKQKGEYQDVPRRVSCTVAWWQVTSNGMGTKLEINGFGPTMDMG